MQEARQEEYTHAQVTATVTPPLRTTTITTTTTMGGDTQLRDLLRDGWAPGAWKSPIVNPTEPYAVVEDHLVRYRGFDTLVPYTFTQLVERIAQPILDTLLDPESHCRVYVLCCDDRSNTPKLKVEEQVDRIQKVKASEANRGLLPVDPYPVGTTLCDAGVQLPDGTQQLLCLRRLALSRWYGAPAEAPWSNLGNQLWQYVLDHLAERMAVCPLEDRTLILDYDKAGPWEVRAGNVPLHRTDWAHGHGESDTSEVWWSKHLVAARPQLKHIVWVSNDTDRIPIYCSYHPRREDKVTLWWHVKPGNTMVDLAKMAEGILERGRDTLQRTPPLKFQSLAQFVFLFIVCGVDNVKKKYYAHGFGCRDLLNAVLKMDYHALKTPEARFDAFLSYLYQAETVQAKQPLVIATKSCPGKRKFETEDDDDKENVPLAETVFEQLRREDRDPKRKKPKWTLLPSPRERAWQAACVDWTQRYWEHADTGERDPEPQMPAGLMEEREARRPASESAKGPRKTKRLEAS